MDALALACGPLVLHWTVDGSNVTLAAIEMPSSKTTFIRTDFGGPLGETFWDFVCEDFGKRLADSELFLELQSEDGK